MGQTIHTQLHLPQPACIHPSPMDNTPEEKGVGMWSLWHLGHHSLRNHRTTRPRSAKIVHHTELPAWPIRRDLFSQHPPRPSSIGANGQPRGSPWNPGGSRCCSPVYCAVRASERNGVAPARGFLRPEWAGTVAVWPCGPVALWPTGIRPLDSSQPAV